MNKNPSHTGPQSARYTAATGRTAPLLLLGGVTLALGLALVPGIIAVQQARALADLRAESEALPAEVKALRDDLGDVQDRQDGAEASRESKPAPLDPARPASPPRGLRLIITATRREPGR